MRSVLLRIFVPMNVRRARHQLLVFLLPIVSLAFSVRANAQRLDSLFCGVPMVTDTIPGVFFGGSFKDTVWLVNAILNQADSTFPLKLTDTINFHLDTNSIHFRQS